MALQRASSGDLIDVRPLQGSLREATSRALFKSEHLEVLRMVLPAGKAVPPHEVRGELTVQCIEGHIEFSAAGSTRKMREGDLICLAGCESYALKAIEDSSCLITIVLHVM